MSSLLNNSLCARGDAGIEQSDQEADAKVSLPSEKRTHAASGSRRFATVSDHTTGRSAPATHDSGPRRSVLAGGAADSVQV